MLKKIKILLLVCVLGVTTSSVLATDFDMGQLDTVFDNSVVEQLVDQSKSRSKDGNFQRQKRPNRPKKKAMRYSLDYAVNRVRRQYNGKVIGARTSWRGGEAIHRVKLKTSDGRIRTISISGTSGR